EDSCRFDGQVNSENDSTLQSSLVLGLWNDDVLRTRTVINGNAGVVEGHRQHLYIRMISAVCLLLERQAMPIDVNERTHIRAILLLVQKDRGQPQVHISRLER